LLGNRRKERIKYFNIPNWCGFYRENYFAFPKLANLSFKSDEIKKAMKILAKIDKAQYDMYLYDWENRRKNDELFEKLQKENGKQKNEIDKQKK
jgi:hypothetical protein